ncbi:hypothetical protein JZ751_028857 [Albula glossodonta]|uniref:SCP domain-containing protein n=1 Tax=Albula glossodonta TaxID=121402 RepID=A0A8T2NAF0_9TELE|nr:hypothetical protein JZ751_028857 [Albula glossodonta]
MVSHRLPTLICREEEAVGWALGDSSQAQEEEGSQCLSDLREHQIRTMARLLSLMLHLMVLMDSAINSQSAEGDQLPDITDQAFIDMCVNAHNEHRSSVNPPASNMRYMVTYGRALWLHSLRLLQQQEAAPHHERTTWDEALAKSARAWARNCDFSHNPRLNVQGQLHPKFHPVGENLWVGENIRAFTAKTAIQKWYDEVTDFSYGTLACTPKRMCGHYKQVVWADSYKVGCAVHICPNGIKEFITKKSAIFVCNYGEAGNFKGVHPYKTGGACSQCSGDRCENKLCRNQTRTPELPNSSAPHTALTLTLLLISAGLLSLHILYPNLLA